MGSNPSKSREAAKTAAAGPGKPTATTTTTTTTKFKTPKFHIVESAAAAAPSAATTDIQDGNKNKTFRDPNVKLRKLVSTNKLMKIASTTKLKVDKWSKRGTKAVANRTNRVRNIFATPLDDQEFRHFKPPVHPKSPEVTEFILAALGKNFVFEQLSEKELDPLVQAFESIDVPPEEVIIRQGDVGDYFYIIGENAAATGGECVFKVDDEEVGRAGQGDSFGELALLYSCPRAATVMASEETRLFRVDQKTFRFILQNQTIQGSQTKGELLQGVEFLKDLDATELSKLASVMTPKFFSAGDYLIRKGEIGECFYLLSEGTLTAQDIGVGAAKYEDVVLQPGQYVGERALVTGEPRAANVIAKTDGMAFCIDKNTFDTVLGQLSVLILRSQDQTKLVRIVPCCIVLFCTLLYCCGGPSKESIP
jgi:cAMP-dependent protein kinase regulator